MCYIGHMVIVRRLIWDAWNIGHIARHGLTPGEVEEVCHGDHVDRRVKKGRLLLTGPTHENLLVSVVLAPEAQGVYYPVTARPASRKERQRYQ